MAREVRERGAVVPALFRWELQNGFAAAVRHKRLSAEEANSQLAAFDHLALEVDQFILSASLLCGFDMAQRFKLTAYDTAYLELAARRSLPIMTRDRRLERAAAELRLLWSPR